MTALNNILEFEATKKGDILSFFGELVCVREKEYTITWCLHIA